MVIVADAVLAELVPARLVVAALALGNTIGQTVVAVPLVLAARRIRGPEAVRGTGRATLAGAAAGIAGAVAGAAVTLALPVSHKLLAAVVAALAAVVAALVFGLVTYLLNDGDLRAALAWLRQVTRNAAGARGLAVSRPRGALPPRRHPREAGRARRRTRRGRADRGVLLAGFHRVPVAVCPLPCPLVSSGTVSAKARLATPRAQPSGAARGRRGHAVGVLGAAARAAARAPCLASSTARSSSLTGWCTSMNSPFGSCLMMPDS